MVKNDILQVGARLLLLTGCSRSSAPVDKPIKKIVPAPSSSTVNVIATKTDSGAALDAAVLRAESPCAIASNCTTAQTLSTPAGVVSVVAEKSEDAGDYFPECTQAEARLVDANGKTTVLVRRARRRIGRSP